MKTYNFLILFWLIVFIAICLAWGCEKPARVKSNDIKNDPCSQIIKSDCEIVFNGEFYAIRRVKDNLFWSRDTEIWAKDRPILFADSCDAKKALVAEINYNKKKIFKPI